MTIHTDRLRDPAVSPFERLTLLMTILRSPEGCNWDRKQTHESLLPYLLEEAYEVIEVIESGNYSALREELGDLLVQIVFHAQLAAERGDFTINDTIIDTVEKLIHRHPHVFEVKQNLDPQQVRDQWEKIKTTRNEKESALVGLPRTMPALTMAFRMGEKAGGLGFDWKQAGDVVEKIDEELAEVKQELQASEPVDKLRLTEEIGDLLFAVASLARKCDIEPELALRRALEKFRDRFSQLEETVRASGKPIGDHSLDQLEAIWQQVKKPGSR